MSLCTFSKIVPVMFKAEKLLTGKTKGSGSLKSKLEHVLSGLKNKMKVIKIQLKGIFLCIIIMFDEIYKGYDTIFAMIYVVSFTCAYLLLLW